MLRLIFSRIGNGVLHLYDNGHILTRTLLPFLLLLAGNLILGGCGVVGILIAAVIDIIAILMLYSSKKDLQQIVDTASIFPTCTEKTGSWQKRSTASETASRRRLKRA